MRGGEEVREICKGLPYARCATQAAPALMIHNGGGDSVIHSGVNPGIGLLSGPVRWRCSRAYLHAGLRARQHSQRLEEGR